MITIKKYWLFMLLVISLVFYSACSGGDNGSGSGSGNGSGGGGSNNVTTGTVNGTIGISFNDNASNYTVFNSYGNTNPSNNGTLVMPISKEKPTFTYAISESGNKVYIAVTTDANDKLNIDARSTAEALVLMNPLLIQRNKEDYLKIIGIVKNDPAVKVLASKIGADYTDSKDPFSNAAVSDATVNAVKSVLTTSQTVIAPEMSSVAPKSNKSLSSRVSEFIVKEIISPLHVFEYDMGALTLKYSSGATLKIDIADAGPIGIKTNVDWVAKIIELDYSKIDWFNGDFIFNPNNIDSLIKNGGYQKKVIIEGEIASGLLGVAVDPIGSIGNTIGSIVFPEGGINLVHDAPYAVVALSGSWMGDDPEYNAIKNSAWQYQLWKEALAINITHATIDSIGVALDILGVPTDVWRDSIDYAFALVESGISSNPGQVGISFAIEKMADIADTMLDFYRPFIHSQISDLQHGSLKKVIHFAVNKAKDVIDVWSGTINAGTRIGNLLTRVTPRESGYVVLGIFPPINPTVAVTPTTAMPGDTLSEWGTGFTPNSTATLHFQRPDGTEFPTLAQPIKSDGSFSITYTIPTNRAAGTYTWWGVDASGKASNTASYIVR